MSLARATILLLVITLLSRALGLAREMVIAWRFGASGETDAFFVAYSIPHAFYNVVGLSLTAVVVPLLAEYESQGRHEEAMRTASLVINVIILSIGLLALVGIMAAPQIAWALGGGFDSVTLKLASQFTAMMMPSIIFMSIAGVLGGILNNRNIFVPTALGPVAMNIIVIGAAVGGAWAGMQGLVAGTVLGSVAFMAVQLPALGRIDYRHRWSFSLKDPVVTRIGGLLWPVMLVSGLVFLYTVIDFRLASAMAEGSITALNYATRLIQLPQALFVMAVTTAIFPSLSKMAANQRKEEMATLLQKGLRIILLLAVPGTVGLVVINEPLIELLFQRGAFSAKATTMTSSALLFLTIGLIGFCLNIPLIRGFYAMQDRHTPLLVGLVSVIVKLLLSICLSAEMQHNGLALATSTTILLNASVLAVLLQQRLGRLLNREFFIFVRGLIFSSVVMGIAIFVLDKILVAYGQHTFTIQSIRIVLDIVVGALIFVVVGSLAQLDVLKDFLERTKALVKR